MTQPYLAGIDAVGRPRRELEPTYPQGWKETDLPRAMLVLVGGRVLERDDLPAIALVFARGAYALGRSIEGAAFPRSAVSPRIFEGSQCLLEVGDDVSITRDLSTNGTLVIPPAEVRRVPSLRIDDRFRKLWDAPCPKVVHAHDVVLTMYAELLLVLL